MNYVSVLLPLALILVVCKVLAILCKKIGMPQVIGYLVGGLLLGLFKLIPGQTLFTEEANDGLGFLAKLGVILIMFSAGLGTDLKKVKSTGLKSVFITSAGVIVPMGLGFVTSMFFLDGGWSNIAANYLEALSYGCILTATSVSVTVATLKEMGKLDTEMGTCIVSAAILDDIIGVVVLSVVLGLDASAGLEQSSSSAVMVNLLNQAGMSLAGASILSIFIYFVIFIGCGIGLSKFFKFLAKKYDHHRRIPIYSLAVAFGYAWCAESIFGVADITGAFLAGILLSTNVDRDYIENKADTFSNIMFTPVFFANIGIGITFSTISPSFVLFGVLFVAVGLLGKFLGCGITAKLCGFNVKESCSIGVGMMVRAEVALVCADKLKDVINPNITSFVVILILISSLVAPVLLKLLNRDKNDKGKLIEPKEVTSIDMGITSRPSEKDQ